MFLNFCGKYKRDGAVYVWGKLEVIFPVILIKSTKIDQQTQLKIHSSYTNTELYKRLGMGVYDDYMLLQKKFWENQSIYTWPLSRPKS